MANLSLKLMILNEIDNAPRGHSEELAKIANFSNGSNLKKVLRDEKKEFDNFAGLVSLVKHIWGEDSLDLMIRYSKMVDPNKKTARSFLEYLAINRKFDEFNQLLDKMDNCSNKESLEFAKIYRMLYKYELATPEEIDALMREINQLNVNVYELKVFKKMLMNYCFSQLNDYTMVKVLSKEIEYEVDLIENDYIKEMYLIRSSQIMSYNYLRVFNNPEAARQCTDNIINSESTTKAFKSYAYYIKGYSYLFTSHEKMVNNLTKSIELYEQQNRTNDVEYIKELIEFANVYWGKTNSEKCDYVKNQLFLDIKKGIDVTDGLTSNKEHIDYELYLYLEGCNSNNNKKLMLSMIKYMKKNDKFLANLAKIELLKNGEDEEILEELIGVGMA